jgi:hypothetical protein
MTIEITAIRPVRPRASGLGSLRHTMPHLLKRASGGDIADLYAASKPNTFNPDPMARAVLSTGRQMAGQYKNPAFYALPGSTAKFQEGGPAEDLEDPDAAGPEEGGEPGPEQPNPQEQQRQIVIEAMLALEGRHPDPKQAIETFVAAFGEEALQELQDTLKGKGDPSAELDRPDSSGGPGLDNSGEGGLDDSGEAPPPENEDELAGAGGGLLEGPGSGQSDEIEAETPSGRPVLLSDGEYVIDAATVSALGDGSTSAGARRLDDMRKSIRKQAYGHDKQAKAMKNGGRSILVELGS